jgi:hypothetical protein
MEFFFHLNLILQLANEAGSTAVATSSNIGSFLTAVEMETGLSDGKSAKIYSGISTISSTVNYRGVYGSDHLLQLKLISFVNILFYYLLT